MNRKLLLAIIIFLFLLIIFLIVIVILAKQKLVEDNLDDFVDKNISENENFKDTFLPLKAFEINSFKYIVLIDYSLIFL